MSDPYRLNDIDVAEGHSKRMDCPKCKSKNTFTVSKQQGVLVYNCYKLGCGLRGASTVGMSAAEIKLTLERLRKRYEEKVVDEPTMTLPVTLTYDITGSAMQHFINKWKLQGVPLLYDIAMHRAVFPIQGKRGNIIDAAGRTLRGDVPKWYRYSGDADFYRYGTGDTAVVVEDCISAAFIGKNIKDATGVAILGTSMNMAHINHLKKYERVVVALDPDAWSKTLQFVKMIKGHSIKATAFKLSDDIKYGNDSDVESLKLLCA